MFYSNTKIGYKAMNKAFSMSISSTLPVKAVFRIFFICLEMALAVVLLVFFFQPYKDRKNIILFRSSVIWLPSMLEFEAFKLCEKRVQVS